MTACDPSAKTTKIDGAWESEDLGAVKFDNGKFYMDLEGEYKETGTYTFKDPDLTIKINGDDKETTIKGKVTFEEDGSVTIVWSEEGLASLKEVIGDNDLEDTMTFTKPKEEEGPAAEETVLLEFDFTKLTELTKEKLADLCGKQIDSLDASNSSLDDENGLKCVLSAAYTNAIDIAIQPTDFTGAKCVIDWEIADWTYGANNPMLSVKLVSDKDENNSWAPTKRGQADFAKKTDNKTSGIAEISIDAFYYNEYDQPKTEANVDKTKVSGIAIACQDATAGTLHIKSIKFVK